MNMELMVIGILNVFVLETTNYLTYDNATFELWITTQISERSIPNMHSEIKMQNQFIFIV